MSKSSSPFFDETQRRIHEILDRFEETLRSTPRPVIEEYLEGQDDIRSELLFELVATDLEMLLKAGEEVRVENYLERFPELGKNQDQLLDLVGREHGFRLRGANPPTLGEYQRRFPQLSHRLSATLETGPPENLSDAENTGPLEDTEQSDLSGESIRYFGDYELLEQIGQGGMGTIYKARQKSLDRIVVVKMIRSGQLADDEEVARFEIEAQAAAALKHPNIVAVHEVGEHEGRHYFSMDYIEGRSLGEIARDTPLADPIAASYMKTVSEAIHFAHQHDTLHRDIKPANILIDAHDQPLVTDFGLAMRLDRDQELTASFAPIGTACYMPPEQAGGRRSEIGPESDVYSLGATLYHLVTGRPPFLATSIGDTIHQVLHDEPVSPRRLNPNLSRDLETIILKCLEKERHKRYHSAEALAEDLGRFLVGRPIMARPVGRVERTWRWAKCNPVVAGLVGTVAATLVVGVIVSSLFAVAASRNATLAATNEGLANERAEEAEGERQRAEKLAHLEQTARQAAETETTRAEAERDRADIATEQTRAHLYATRMNLAQQAWNDGHIYRVRQLLETEKPVDGRIDRRGIEWNYLSRLCNSDLASFEMNNSANNLEFSPDGQLLAASGYRQVTVWSVREKKLIHHFGVKGIAQCIAFSPDSRTVASADGVGNLGFLSTIMVWNIDSGEKTELAKCVGPVGQLVFSPDGTQLAATVRCNPLGVIDQIDNRVGRFDPRIGQQVAEIKVWQLSDGKELYSIGFDVPNLGDKRKMYSAALKAPDYRIAFSPDGGKLAGVPSILNDGLGIGKVWDATDGHELLKLKSGANNKLMSAKVLFSPDGRTITAGGTTWNLSDGNIVSSRRPYIASDGKRAAAIEGRVIIVWDVETQEDIATMRGDTSKGYFSYNLAFSPDGWRMASSTGKTIHIWDTQVNQESDSLRHGDSGPRLVGGPPMRQIVRQVALSPDGLQVATAAEVGLQGERAFQPTRIQVWDRISGQQLLDIRHPSYSCHNLEFNPDGSLLAGSFSGSPSDRGTVIWDSRSGELLHHFEEEGLHNTIRPAVFSPDGKTIATIGGKDQQPQEVVLRNVVTGKVIRRLSETWHDIRRLAFSPDGLHLAVGANKENKPMARATGTITVWDVTNGNKLKSCLGPIECMAYSPDGKLLATGSPYEVKVFNARTLDKIVTLDDAARHIAFGPDSRRLLTGGDDLIRVRDVDSWQEVLGFRGGSGLSFDLSASFLVALGSDGARIWDLRPTSTDDVIEREAIGVLRFLNDQQLTPEERANRIRDDHTIGNKVKKRVLSLLAAP